VGPASLVRLGLDLAETRKCLQPRGAVLGDHDQLEVEEARGVRLHEVKPNTLAFGSVYAITRPNNPISVADFARSRWFDRSVERLLLEDFGQRVQASSVDGPAT
jgi:hypothetical protein